jgi:hypothetical protein
MYLSSFMVWDGPMCTEGPQPHRAQKIETPPLISQSHTMSTLSCLVYTYTCVSDTRTHAKGTKRMADTPLDDCCKRGRQMLNPEFEAKVAALTAKFAALMLKSPDAQIARMLKLP